MPGATPRQSLHFFPVRKSASGPVTYISDLRPGRRDESGRDESRLYLGVTPCDPVYQ